MKRDYRRWNETERLERQQQTMEIKEKRQQQMMERERETAADDGERKRDSSRWQLSKLYFKMCVQKKKSKTKILPIEGEHQDFSTYFTIMLV